MPDRRFPEIGDAHLAAPAGDHLFGGFGEGRIVFLDVADRAEADADDTAKLGGVRELEQHTIDPVERFGHFLDHQHVIGEIGKPGRADHAGEDREVEGGGGAAARSEEHTSALQSLMRISYAVFFLKKKTKDINNTS